MTNFAFGVGRQDYSNYGGDQRDYVTGQMIGDAISTVAGAVIAYGGATAIGAGTGALAVGSAGVGVVAIPAGAAAASAAMTYGTGVAATSGFNFAESSKVREAYKRPSNATTLEQRQAVQGQPCAECGTSAPKMYADHIKPLVKEYYEKGKLNLKRILDLKAVQPQCPTCSNRQGGRLSGFAKKMKQKLGL